MSPTLSEPTIITHGPWRVVGCWTAYEGEDEGPGWAGAWDAFSRLRSRITGRIDDLVLGFLYRPHKDDPEIPAGWRACFVGVNVAEDAPIPPAMEITRFSGGEYVIVACQGDTADEAAEGVGQAIGYLTEWMPAHGYREGDACFACSDEHVTKPPYIEYVYIKIERA